MNREEILASGVYMVATKTPPEIVCPEWCTWTADEHRAELYQADGEVYHASRRYEVQASWAEGSGKHSVLEVGLSQATFVDGTPSPLDVVNHGQPVINIQGMEFAAPAALEVAHTIIEAVATAGSPAAPPTSSGPNDCPSWCQTAGYPALRGPDGCNEHWSNPGSEPWPFVRATAYPQDGTPNVAAHPVWAHRDDHSPAVGLYLQTDELDKSIDMTPDEAVTLGLQLLRAARAVKAG